MKNFSDRIIEAIIAKRSYLCVGLDPQLKYFPPHLLAHYGKMYGETFEAVAEAIIAFNKSIIDVTNEYALCYKPQLAFYEKYGSEGIRAYEETVEYLNSVGMLCIGDGKREDGGDTSEAYAEGHLGIIDMIDEKGEIVSGLSPYDVDALTITPWIDLPNFNPFINVCRRDGKGVFVVTKSSFKPASRLQEMVSQDGKKAWVLLAEIIKEMGEEVIGENGYSSIGLVMGATYPEEAETMKEIIPKAFKLIPGFGLQGGGPDSAVVSINDDGFGAIVNNSRGTNYAWHPELKTGFECSGTSFGSAAAKACEQARDALNASVFKKIGKLPW